MTDELLKLMETSVGRNAIEDTIWVVGTLKTLIKLTKSRQADHHLPLYGRSAFLG